MLTQRSVRTNPIIYKTFIVGGEPTTTYVNRDNGELEDQLIEYLKSKHKILSITGPTKSGKTVLVRKTLKDYQKIEIAGGEITTISEFWQKMLFEVNLPSKSSVTESDGDQSERTEEVSATASAGTPILPSATFKRSNKTGKSRGRSRTDFTEYAAQTVVLHRLKEKKPIVIIDDFHYIPENTQREIVRSFKNLVYDGLPLIVISVPHHSFDVIAVQREMTGRIWDLEIPAWTQEELSEIPRVGFEKLKLEYDESLITGLLNQVFESPYLMQEFCLETCRANKIPAAYKTFKLRPPDNWEIFYRNILKRNKAVCYEFKKMSAGPRLGAARKMRTLKSGKRVDLYQAVLLAIVQTGSFKTLEFEDIRAALRDIMPPPIPRITEITRVLRQMEKISKEAKRNESVIEVDDDCLNILDPFLAFYLRWGIVESNNGVDAEQPKPT